MKRAMLVTIVGLLVVQAASMEAQIGRTRTLNAGPDYWVGLSYGLIDGATIVDGNSGSQWNFGYSSQIRATFEKVLQPGFTGGISAGFSTAPLTYSGSAIACGGSCRADADITQWMAFLNGTGGGSRGFGFHYEYTLEAGATTFSNFRVHDTSTQLAPTDSHYDFTFGLGGGFGYSFSPTMQIYATEVGDLVLHDEGSAVTTTAPRIYTFRLGGRVGF